MRTLFVFIICVIFQTAFSATQTNSFQLLLDFESGQDGPVTKSLLTNGTKSITPLNGSWTFSPDNATNFITFSSLFQFSFPTNYWWSNIYTPSIGSRTLAVSHDGPNNLYVRRGFPQLSPPLSFGVYVVANLTNTIATMFWDFMYFGSVDGFDSNSCAIEYRSDLDVWYCHGTSNGVIENGPFIYGSPIGSTNWITGLITTSNYLMAVYDPFTWQQIGSNSYFGRGNANIDSIRIFQKNAFQNGKTSYVDNVIVNTNGLFPLLPIFLPQYYPGTSEANSTEYGDVLSVVTNSTNGNLVLIPPGKSTWTNTLYITNAITILGASSNLTFITNSISTNATFVGSNGFFPPIFYSTYTNGMGCRVSSLSMECNWVNGGMGFYINPPGNYPISGFRVDHCYLHKAFDYGIIASGYNVYGVIDHCTFNDCLIPTYAIGGNALQWTNANPPYYTLGTTNSLVIEDCYYYGTVSNLAPHGSDYGAVWTIRNSIITNFVGGIDAHGNHRYRDDPSGPLDGTICLELYKNQMHYETQGVQRATSFRGGTCLVFSNDFFGTNCSIQMQEEEYWANFFVPLLLSWPATEQITNSFYWANTLNITNTESVSLYTSNNATQIAQDRDYFLHSPWQIPYVNGDGALNALYNYSPLIYPHPLVTLEDGLSNSPPYHLRILGKAKFLGKATIR